MGIWKICLQVCTNTAVCLCTNKDWDLQELLMKMNFMLAVAPPFVHPMTSLTAMPTHSVRKYGSFNQSSRQRQVAKYGNLKHRESLSFSGDIQS